jgi:hypothetical protein
MTSELVSSAGRSSFGEGQQRSATSICDSRNQRALSAVIPYRAHRRRDATCRQKCKLGPLVCRASNAIECSPRLGRSQEAGNAVIRRFSAAGGADENSRPVTNRLRTFPIEELRILVGWTIRRRVRNTSVHFAGAPMTGTRKGIDRTSWARWLEESHAGWTVRQSNLALDPWMTHR